MKLFKRRKTKLIFICSICTLLLAALVAGALFLFLDYLPKKREAEELQKHIELYTQSKLSIYEQENEQYDDYEVDVAFIGDSLTDFYDLNHYYPQYTVSNRGIGGDTTVRVENRLKTSLYDLKPKLVVMLIGFNNIFEMFDNYERILLALKENLPNTKVVLVSLTPTSRDWKELNTLIAYFNVKIKIFAEKYSFEYVDLFTKLFDIESEEMKAEYTTDGIHLSSKGYEVFTRELTPVLEKLLNK